MNKEQEAVNKLGKVYIKLSQDLGFNKFFLKKDNEEIEYMKEIEREIRESLELLGYDVNELIYKLVR